MGIHIGITVSTHVSPQRWQEVYREVLDLAKRLNLAEHRKKMIHGHAVRCLMPTEESMWNGKRGFWAAADYNYRDSGEGFFFPEELRKPEDDEPVDILTLRADQIDMIQTELPGKNYQEIWGNKTQGHTYHIAMLAIGCFVQDRLGDDALVHSSINAGQCRRAVELANQYLENPIHVPCQCDAESWFDRIERLAIEGTDKVRIAENMFIGRKDAAFGEKLRAAFSHDLLTQYWREEMAEYHMKANGFAWRMKDYLSMGFDVGELCGMVNFMDDEGNDMHEHFIGMLMGSKMHWKEKDCRDWIEQDPEDPALESVASLMIRAFASGCRNKNVDRYIPIEQLRQILHNRLGAECDTDALVDAYLQQEELDNADEKNDQSGELNRIMKKTHDGLEKLYEEYDIPLEHMLLFYKPGNTIAPKTEALLQEILAFGDEVLDSEHYEELISGSVKQQGAWLAYASDQFYGDLKDTDWEHIFDNLEKDPENFVRYYPLFRIELSNRSVRDAVKALVVNDDLYAYVRTLPQMEKKD